MLKIYFTKLYFVTLLSLEPCLQFLEDSTRNTFKWETKCPVLKQNLLAIMQRQADLTTLFCDG